MPRIWLAPIMATLLLAGCDSLPWLGNDEGPPLPGERKAVLLATDNLAADPRIASLTVTVPPASAAEDWPLPGGLPNHAGGNLAGTGGFTTVWRASIGAGSSDGSPLMSAPIMAEGKVFAVDAEGDVTALSAGDGSRLWSRELYERTPDRLAGGGVAYDGGRLFVALSNGEVVALSAGSGEEIWRVALRLPLRAPPTVAGDRVLLRTADNQLIALELAAGEIVWRHAESFEPAGLLGGSTPAVAGNVVTVAYSSGEVFGLLLDSGRELWSETVRRARRVLAIDAISDITAAPVIDGDRVYVASAGGEMAALDLARGVRVWDADLTAFDTPWTAGDFIYVVTERGELVCLLRQGGRVRWVTPISTAVTAPDETAPTDTLWSGPIMVNGRILVVGTGGEIAAFSAVTGELVERSELPGGSRLPPVAANGTVYVLDDRGYINALR